MKIKTLNQAVLNTDNQPIRRDDGQTLKLRDVINNSILAPLEGDDEKKKFERWEIYKIIKDASGEVSLTAEQIAVIKRSIGKLQPPLILGQCFEMLEGEVEMTVVKEGRKK
jgi:hypothetical protein